MRKVKYSNLLILGIFIYIMFYGVIAVLGKSVKTQVLQIEKDEMKISRKSLIVRDEYLLKSDTNGKLSLLVDEGEKVANSQEVANVYNNIDENINTKISSLNEEIDKIKSGEINISKNDISEFNKNIELISNKVQEDLLEKNYNDIKENKETLNNYMNDKNKLVNNGIDSAKLATKEEQKEILENQRNKSVSTYCSSIAGIISYKFDGKEEIYNYDNLNEITKSDIENEKNEYEEVKSNSQEIKEGSTILRVINNYDAYVVTYIDEDEVKYFEENQSVKLRSNNEEIDGIVYKIYNENNNFIVVMKINNQNIGIYDTRVKEFDIIYKQIEGLKVPKTAIKTVDNKDGVYVVSEENKTPSFVELNGITYEDENYKYINYYNKIDDVSTVDLYDKIILKPNFINTKMKIE